METDRILKRGKEMDIFNTGFYPSSAAALSRNLDKNEEATRLKQESQQATIKASKELVQIKYEVASLRESLDKERDERLAQDQDNREYTRKMDRRNFRISVVAAISGVIGTIIAIVALVVSLVK